MDRPEAHGPTFPSLAVRALVGSGRLRRLAPFALVAVSGLAVAPLPPAVRAGPFAAATAITCGLGLAVLLLPWHRWPAAWEAVPPFAFFGVIAVLRSGTVHGDDGAVTSGYAPLVLLPLAWLALYHGTRLLLAGIVLAGLTVLQPAMSHGIDYPGELRLSLLWILAGGVSAWSTSRLVRHNRHATEQLARSAVALATVAEQLRAERDLTAAVLDTAGFLVVAVDPETRVTVFNQKCEALTGLRATDVLGRPFEEVLGDRVDVVDWRRDLVGHGSEAFPTEQESNWLDASGEPRTILWRDINLTDPGGRVTHAIATGMDVTDQRRSERLIAHVLAAPVDQAIIATDREGVVTLFNAGAERLLGYPADDVVGHITPIHWHLPEELATRAAPLGVAPGPDDVEHDGEPQEWTYVRADGARVPVAVSTSVIRDQRGTVTGYLGVARDVTRERAAADAMRAALEREMAATESLREIDRVRSDLVATVSHELRTPLTSILGNVELLADGDAGPLAGMQARLVAAIERNSRRLLVLIEDLLMLSRIESGVVKINSRPVPVRAIIGGALEAVQAVRAGRGVDLQVELPAEPVVVLGDQAQLERVLINLVDNGLKFTPAGGQVRVCVDDDGDGFARLVVTDTGIGIPPDEVDLIFDRFFRSTRSQEREMQGTGLGLAITRSIVERHGGRIWATAAEEGTGTEVTCLIPCA
jgi:PAS domain S-box-containing protein